MLILIGLGVVSGVFIGKKILENSIKKNKIQKETNSISQKPEIDYQNKITLGLKTIAQTLDSIPYAVYKRLHSITGILFVGGFVVVHFINNSIAYNPKKLNELSKSIHKNPLFPLVEIVGIYTPLISHIVIGLILLRKGRIDLRIRSETNYRYILQRISAYVILKTLLFHLITIRFNEYIPERIRRMLNIPSKRDLAYQKVSIWFRSPLWPIGYVAYTLFTVSIAYHLSNGIWTSAITWGLAKTYEKQVKLRKFSNLSFIILSLWAQIIMYLYSKPYTDQEE
ncbi:MAG: hypothetical protein RMJ51_04795 [Candidatus Calescibacterium sp.]|nr:hypothetical protein [Candidatus Calescibacterium sp.]MCX7972732.1 hypothetical protein [bacterium]MDW8195536.1 hypothetical protein [Candidatus Calescibacterium sp.]